MDEDERDVRTGIFLAAIAIMLMALFYSPARLAQSHQPAPVASYDSMSAPTYNFSINVCIGRGLSSSR
jgi:hypothetical protein